MSQSQILYRLQQIDSQLDQARARAINFERLLSENSELQKAEQAVIDAQQIISIELENLQKAEKAVQEHYIKIEQTEAALYGGKIHIPKELQDLQTEAAALKRYLNKLEDTQLECMLAVEAAQSNHKRAIDAFDKVHSDWIEQTAQLNNEFTQTRILIMRLESERIAAINPISADLLVLYENLRKQRNGVAVAIVSAKSCGACGTTLTPAAIQSAQSASTLVRCPTCNRILYSG